MTGLSEDVKNASFGQDKKTKNQPVPIHIQSECDEHQFLLNFACLELKRFKSNNFSFLLSIHISKISRFHSEFKKTVL